MFYFLILVPLFSYASEISIQIPTPESLNFTRARFVNPAGDSVTIFVDNQTGWRTQVTEHRLRGQLDPNPRRVVEIYNQNAELTEKSIIGEVYWTQETAWPRRERREIVWSGNRHYVQSLYRWDEKKRRMKFHSQMPLPVKAFAESCPAPLPFEDLDRRISSLQSVIKVASDPEVKDGPVVSLGANVLAYNCEKYLPGGIAGLAAELEAAIDMGVRCIAGLGSQNPEKDSISQLYYNKRPAKPELIAFWRAQAALILGLFEAGSHRQFGIICDKPGEFDVPEFERNFLDNDIRAVARICGLDPTAPGLALNLYTFSTLSRASRLSTLFHEVLHQSGKLHDLNGDTFDAVYAAETCCFGHLIPEKEIPERDHYSCVSILHRHHEEEMPSSEGPSSR